MDEYIKKLPAWDNNKEGYSCHAVAQYSKSGNAANKTGKLVIVLFVFHTTSE